VSLLTITLFAASMVAALCMGIATNKRERFAIPERRRRLIGFHEIGFPLDESRYQPQAVPYHRMAQRAFWAMILLFVAGLCSAILGL
jgi:hypothetical protein